MPRLLVLCLLRRRRRVAHSGRRLAHSAHGRSPQLASSVVSWAPALRAVRTGLGGRERVAKAEGDPTGGEEGKTWATACVGASVAGPLLVEGWRPLASGDQSR